MNKRFCVFCLILLAIGFLGAQPVEAHLGMYLFENSSRYQATSGIFLDEWDLIIDYPFALSRTVGRGYNESGFFNGGTRLYTNLSNLTGGEERFTYEMVVIPSPSYTHYTDNRYMIGVANIPYLSDRGINAALALQVKKWKHGDATDSTFTYYMDTDIVGKWNSQADEQLTDGDLGILAAIGYEVSDILHMGASFIHKKNTYYDDEYDVNWDWTITDPDSSMNLVDRYDEHCTDLDDQTLNLIRLAGRYEGSDQMDVVVRASVGLRKDRIEWTDDESHSVDYNPNGTNDPNFTTQKFDTTNTGDGSDEVDGTGFEFLIKPRYEVSDMADLYGYFWLSMFPGNYDYRSQWEMVAQERITYYNSSDDAYYVGQETDKTSSLSQRSGDAKENLFGIGGKAVLELAEGAHLGLGASWQKMTSKQDYDGDFSYSSSEVVDDGNPDTYFDPNHGSEWTWEYTRTGELKGEDEEKVTVISFPVGVEFEFRENWTARLGARHSITTTEDITTTYQRPWTERTTYNYADPALSDTTIVTEHKDEGSSKTTEEWKSSSTVFSYGAGWEINENLHLDFMCFSELLNMRYWQISLIARFF